MTILHADSAFALRIAKVGLHAGYDCILFDVREGPGRALVGLAGRIPSLVVIAESRQATLPDTLVRSHLLNFNTIPVVWFTDDKGGEIFRRACSNRASGLIHDEDTHPSQERALAVIEHGGVYFSPTARSGYLSEDFSFADEKLKQLSRRQLEVVALMASGALNQNIADELGISLNTVRAHQRIISGKLRLGNALNLRELVLKKSGMDGGQSEGGALGEGERSRAQRR